MSVIGATLRDSNGTLDEVREWVRCMKTFYKCLIEPHDNNSERLEDLNVPQSLEQGFPWN
jgi:hypothetical protein